MPFGSLQEYILFESLLAIKSPASKFHRAMTQLVQRESLRPASWRADEELSLLPKIFAACAMTEFIVI